MAVDLTRELVAVARAITPATLPDWATRLARDCVLDTLAVAVAGRDDRLVAILLADAAEDGGTPAASVIGRPERLPGPVAARVNGAMAHALDYDDVTMAMPGHPSVAILPALWALAEATGADQPAFNAAFVAGYEVACRVGRAIAPGHYDGLGFHATGTLGALGAAAACAHLIDLDEARFANAIGIAATRAAGLKSMFGTMCKPLHAGLAAEAGLSAARLAARGFTSRADALDCAQGFCRTHSPDFFPERALANLEAGLYIRENLFKFHAACYLTHAPIECAMATRADDRVSLETIVSIRLRVDQAVGRVCDIAAPRDGLEAKFSLRLAVAMGLAGVDTARLDTFSAAVAADPMLVALRDRVDVVFQSGWPHTRAALDVTLRDNTTVTTEHDAGVPAPDLAVQRARVTAKARGLLGPARADAIGHALDRGAPPAAALGASTLPA